MINQAPDNYHLEVTNEMLDQMQILIENLGPLNGWIFQSWRGMVWHYQFHGSDNDALVTVTYNCTNRFNEEHVKVAIIDVDEMKIESMPIVNNTTMQYDFENTSIAYWKDEALYS